MNGEERFNNFIDNINNWISSNGIIQIKPNDDAINILNMNRSEISRLTSSQCMEFAYELYAYAEYLDSLLSKQKIAFDWAEDSIWYIISDKMNNYGDKYSKWQQKYFSAVKENPLTADIIKVKNTASARIKLLEGKIESIKKMSDILYNLAKRK